MHRCFNFAVFLSGPLFLCTAMDHCLSIWELQRYGEYKDVEWGHALFYRVWSDRDIDSSLNLHRLLHQKFDAVFAGHHSLAHPSTFLQPIPLLLLNCLSYKLLLTCRESSQTTNSLLLKRPSKSCMQPYQRVAALSFATTRTADECFRHSLRVMC